MLEGGDVGDTSEADEEGEPLAVPGRTLVVGVALEVGFPGPDPQPSVYTTMGWHLAQPAPES